MATISIDRKGKDITITGIEDYKGQVQEVEAFDRQNNRHLFKVGQTYTDVQMDIAVWAGLHYIRPTKRIF